MFSKFIYYKKKKKYCVHFGEDDIVIDDIILNPVHILPKEKIESGREFDFYMDDKSDFYLLRLVNNNDNTITLVDYGDLRYIIICTPITNIYCELTNIVYQLKKLPYGEKIKGKQKTYKYSI